MSKEMREQIDRFRNLIIESKSNSFANNRKRIREYIKTIKSSDKYDPYIHNQWIDILIILHNFLHIEEKFKDEVELNNKEINKYLNLPKTNDFDEILNIVKKYYDTNSKVRFGLETLDSIDEIRDYINNLSGNIFSKIQTTLK